MTKLFILLLSFSSYCHAQVTPENRQLVIVISPGWEHTKARMFRFVRQDDNLWKQAPIDPVPVVLGRSGMAWGLGLHSASDIPKKSPLKVEGDGKAPAGVFRFGLAFGYDELKSIIKLDKLRLSPSIECVDDVASDYYNKIVDRKLIPEPDWKSSEIMRRKDELYRFGIVVDHNTPPAKKEKGSCIFFHVWDGPESTTSGCTATHEFHIRTLMDWLQPDLKPVLVQLPWNEYLRLKTIWNLPEISKSSAGM